MIDPLPILPIASFQATLTPPGSKSLTNRALLLAALAQGPSTLTNILLADDSIRMIQALRDLGYKLDLDEPARTLRITGTGALNPAPAAPLFLGNAGTAFRFLTAACCLGTGRYTLDGIPRMRQRPIGQLVDPLRALGARIDYLGDEGFPPLAVHGGGLTGAKLMLQPTLSSQYISALLQIAPLLEKGLEIGFQGPITSLPYVRMTLELMRRFGARFTAAEDHSQIIVQPGAYRAGVYDIEPDASNASYFLAAAAILPGSRCTIAGLGSDSLQGDVRFAKVLADMGASARMTADSITVQGPAALRGVDVDLNDMPDMAQTLAIVALFAQGPTTIRNIGNLRVKETDRLEALRVELSKLGAAVQVNGDDLSIQPPAGGLKPADIHTYDDHRMAMSFAVAGLRSPGVRICDPACVNKTFPDYFDHLARLGQAHDAASGPRGDRA